MLSWSHFFIGLAAAVVGTLMLRFNFRLVGYTGRQDWIEDHLGNGTTYFVYQVVAVIVVISGLLYATGLGSNVLGWLLSPFEGIFGGLRGK